MNNTIQKGDTLDLTAPAGGVENGQGYIIGGFFAVAGNRPFAAGEKFPAVLVNVVSLTKTAAEVWAEGDLVYWDDTAKEASNVAGDMLIEAASAAAAGPDATGAVRLNAISTPEPVAPASATIFVSALAVGTGVEVDIAHGLGVIPSAVTAHLYSGHDGAGAVGTQAAQAVEGAHDATNVKINVTDGAEYKVTAYV